MLKINPSVVHRAIDGKVYIADPGASMLYELNETATFLWRLIVDKKAGNLEEIVSRIVTEYDIDDRTARTDVDKVLKYLIRKKLISVV